MKSWELEAMIESFAINAEIEGMKAENSIRLINDKQISYSEKDFIEKTNELYHIINRLRKLS